MQCNSRVRRGVRCGVLAATIVVPAVIYGQRDVFTTAAPPVRDPAADRAAITLDSLAGLSWVLPGQKDWASYIHPEECFGAAEIDQRMDGARTNWSHPTPAGDSLSTATRAAVRACIAKFSPQTVDDREAQSLLRVALLVDDIPLARAIIDTRLSRAKTTDEKASVLLDATTAMANRSPDRLAIAESLALRMQTLGTTARPWVPGALGLVEFLSTQVVFDTTLIARLERPILPLYNKLTHDERMKSGPPAYMLVGKWWSFQEYRRIAPDSLCAMQRALAVAMGTDATLGSDYIGASEALCPSNMSGVGKPVAAFTGGTWFTPGDTAGRPSLGFPRDGRVTLVINEPLGNGRPTSQEEIYRRLYDRYAKEGLDIVVVHQRTGFAWGDAALTPAVESQLIRWYDHDYLKLPFPIAVYDDSAAAVPQAALIGRDGRKYMKSSNIDDGNGVLLEAFIQQALTDVR